MPKKTEPTPTPALPATGPFNDGPDIKNDPVNRRVIALFDALLRRGVSPDKAASAVWNIHRASDAANMFNQPFDVQERIRASVEGEQ